MKTFERFGENTMHRFYQGAEHIGSAVAKGRNASITRLTLEEAVKDAQKTLAREPNRDTIIIVEIVAVVHRTLVPVEVEILTERVK